MLASGKSSETPPPPCTWIARSTIFSATFGAAGVSDDAGLARDYASMRTMRLADGPDEVHNRAIARLELRKYANAPTTH